MDQEIRITAQGGADVLTCSAHTPQVPGPTQIRVRQHAIGVNFADIYFRSGLYPMELPTILGMEGTGVVEAVGSSVDSIRPGDRVAYAGLPLGAYASTRMLEAERAIVLPDTISFDIAAASMLRGLTAYMLINDVYKVGPSSTLLVRAAAGGLGLMISRWAKLLGARVIGTASTETKANIALDAGVDHVIVGRAVNLVKEVAMLTDDEGVDVVYDGVGGSDFPALFSCVRPFGVVASLGQAGGKIEPISPSLLSPRTAFLARPSVIQYISETPRYQQAAKALLATMEKGVVGTVGHRYKLADAAQAHKDMEAGQTSGSLLLIPG